MRTYIIRRLLSLILVLFGVSILIFSILMTFEPERRAAAYVTTPQQAKDIPKLIIKYGLEDPFYIQYFRWIKSVFKGNMGYSLVASLPVTEAFMRYVPVTIEMNLYAIPLIIIIGIWLGTISGINKDKPVDHISRIVAIVGWSLPTYVLALLALMIFYGYFHLFPPGVLDDKFLVFIEQNPDKFIRYTYLYTVDALLNGRFDIFIDAINHLVLPVFSYVIVIVALIMRLMRSGIVEELSKDFIITARAKGADEHTVNYIHARKNALLPVITVAGQLVAMSLVGSISVEYIFNRTGIGWWLAQSTTQLDMPVIMSLCLYVGLFVVLINLLIDILYAYFDPRIRLN